MTDILEFMVEAMCYCIVTIAVVLVANAFLQTALQAL
jgi:hypothetical protein